MSQLNIYVSDELEKKIRKAAKKEGKSLSSYLSDLLKRKFESRTWPPHFFSDLAGKWEGEFPEIMRPEPQKRDEL